MGSVSLRRSARAAIVALSVFGLSSIAASGAVAQQEKPSPERLWQQYPLDADKGRIRASPSSTPTPQGRPPQGEAATASNDNVGAGTPWLVVLVAFGAGLILSAAMLRYARVPAAREDLAEPSRAAAVPPKASPPKSGPPKPRPPKAGPSRPAPAKPTLVKLAPEKPAPAKLSEPAQRAPSTPAQPPRRASPKRRATPTGWSCAIEWKPGYFRSRFRAVAIPPGAVRGKAIADSPRVRWPAMQDPHPPDAELLEAHAALVEALTSAGWSRTRANRAWFADTFEWAATGDPPPHIDVAPLASVAGWVCSIEWKPGYLKSNFRAVASPPGTRRTRAVAESPRVSWPPMSVPNPQTDELRASLDVLSVALTDAGWTPTGNGAGWYERHYRWTADDDPPTHIDVHPIREMQDG